MDTRTTAGGPVYRWPVPPEPQTLDVQNHRGDG